MLRSKGLSEDLRFRALCRLLWRGMAALGVLLWLTDQNSAQAPSNGDKMLVKAKRLLDVKTGQYQNDAGVLVAGDRIEEVGPVASVALHAPKDVRVIDLGDATLLPGLIDAHTHLLQNNYPRIGDEPNLLITVAAMSTASRALLGAAMGRQDLEAGITTVRDVGNSGMNGDVALRDAINSGWVEGPRMMVSTRALSASGGQFGPDLRVQHGLQGFIDQEYAIVGSPEEARRAVQQAIYDGADIIKVIVSTQISAEELRSIVEEAHRAGKKVAAHAISEYETRTAAEAGVDSIEHAYDIPDDALKVMTQKHIFLVPTDGSGELWERNIRPEGGDRATPEEKKAARDLAASVFEWRSKRLRRAMAAGVPIAAGSDVYVEHPGITRGQASVEVIRGYVESGMSSIDAIRSATINAAQLLGWEKQVGSLESGKYADMIAVSGEPLKEISKLERVRFVMKGGIIVKGATDVQRKVPALTRHSWF